MTIRNWKISTKLFVAFFVLVLTMLSTAAINWVQVTTAHDATDEAITRSLVIRKVDALMASMIDQETGIRGYLIAGQTGFLDPYRSGQENLSAIAAKLREEWSQNPNQIARLNAFLAMAGTWKSDVAEREIRLMQVPGTQGDAHQMVSSGAGKAHMDGS